MNTEEPIRCCAALRSKSMYYRPDERPGVLHESDVMPHWCAKTHLPVGPDEQDATPGKCQPGRVCYEEP
jgi:hypothetical protein